MLHPRLQIVNNDSILLFSVSVHLVWRSGSLQRGASDHPSTKHKVFAVQSVKLWQQRTRSGGYEVHPCQGDNLDGESSFVWTELDDISRVSVMSGTSQTSDTSVFSMFFACVQSRLSAKSDTQTRMQTFVREQSESQHYRL